MGLLTQSDFESLIWQIEHSRSTDGTKEAVISAYAAALERIAELEQANMNYAVNVCPEQDRIIAEQKVRIAALEAERRWIPVSERLPKEGVKVNILYDTPCVEDEPDVAVYIGDDLWATGPEEYLDRVYCKVTHWMPLPAAPE